MRLLWTGTLLLTACSDNEFARATKTDSFSQAPSNKVDILWVIDNSTSMQEEQDAVAAAADSFLTVVETADMDFHLGVISTDISDTNADAGVLLGSPNVMSSDCLLDGDAGDCTYKTDFEQLVKRGTDGDDQEKGLGAALAAVSPPLIDTYNAGFLRDDSLLMIIILSDENDCTDDGALGATATGENCYTEYDKLVPVSNLVRDLEDVKAETGGVVLNGIIGPDVADHCSDSVPGSRYQTAIEMLGGIEADICQDDYTENMSEFGLRATGILDTFQLSKQADPDTIEVEVDPPDLDPFIVEADDVNGYTYIEDYAQIHFNGDSVPARGSLINVKYTIAGNVPETTTDDGT